MLYCSDPISLELLLTKNPTQRKGQNLTENALNYCEFSVLVKRYESPEFDLSPQLTKTLNPT